MKALTIKQPYASLIVNGYKEYEFRTWETNYRGKLLIHAGLTLEPPLLNKVESYNIEYTKGAIIGEVELTDCILVDETLDKKLRKLNPNIYANDHVNMYAWKLENIKKYDKPIYIKGKLGLWNYEEGEQI